VSGFTVDTDLLQTLISQVHPLWLQLAQEPVSDAGAATDGQTGSTGLTDALHQYNGVARTQHATAADALSGLLTLFVEARQAYDGTDGKVAAGGKIK
jgi:hypothetical protein